MAKGGRVRKRSERKALLLLLCLQLAGPVGRYRLKEILNLAEHEGVVKLMLEELRREKVVTTSKLGCELSGQGRKYLNSKLREYGIKKYSAVDLSPFHTGQEAYCIQVAKCAERIGNGMEQRDIAVRAGADGAIVIAVEDGVLTVPPEYSLDKNFPEVAARLRDQFAPARQDVIVVGLSSEKWRAVEGALAASMSLSGPWE